MTEYGAFSLSVFFSSVLVFYERSWKIPARFALRNADMLLVQIQIHRFNEATSSLPMYQLAVANDRTRP